MSLPNSSAWEVLTTVDITVVLSIHRIKTGRCGDLSMRSGTKPVSPCGVMNTLVSRGHIESIIFRVPADNFNE